MSLLVLYKTNIVFPIFLLLSLSFFSTITVVRDGVAPAAPPDACHRFPPAQGLLILIFFFDFVLSSKCNW